MRYFLLTFLCFAAACAFGQGRKCRFPYNSVINANDSTRAQFLDILEGIELKSYYRKRKIPGFIKRTIKCWHPGFRLSNVERHTFKGKHLWFFILKDLFRHRKELLFVGLNDHYMLLCITNGSSCFSNYPMYLVKFEKRKIVSAWYGITFDENVRSKEDVLKYIKQGSSLPIISLEQE
jgi:hypothetical protein